MAAEMQARAAHQPHTQSPQQELGPATNTDQTVAPAAKTTGGGLIEVAEGTSVEKSDKKLKKATILKDLKLPSTPAFRSIPFSSLHKHHSTHHMKVLFVLPVGTTSTNGPLTESNLAKLFSSLTNQQQGGAAIIQHQQVEQQQQQHHLSVLRLPSSTLGSLSPLSQTTSTSDSESSDIVPSFSSSSSSSSSCASSPCSPDAEAAEAEVIPSAAESLPSNNNNNHADDKYVYADVVDHVDEKQKSWTPESVNKDNTLPFTTQAGSHTCSGCNFTN